MRIDLLTTCATCGTDGPDGAHYCAACGYEQPGRVPDAHGEVVDLVDPQVTPALLPTQPSQTSLLVTIGIVALLLCLTVPLLVVRAVFYGPDDIVRDYFSALAARDAKGAWAALDPGLDAGHEPLLSAAAVANPGYAPPANFVLTHLDTDGEDATATVAYTVDGSAVTDVLKLHEGKATNLLQRWHITDGARPVLVQSPGGSPFQLAGVTIQAGSGGASLPAFPGRYTLSLADNPLFAADPVPVHPGDQQAAVLNVHVSPAAETAVTARIKQYIDQCAKSTQAAPNGCPFGVSSGAYAEPVHWDVLSYPTYQMSVGDNGQVVVGSQSSGTVRITGGPNSYYPPDTQSFSVQGTATADGTNIQFTTGQ